MVSLYFGHVSLHSSALPIPVNQTPKLTEILCLQMLCLPCAFLSYSGVFPIPAFLESCKPNEPLQNYFSYRYVSKGTLCGLSCSCRDVVHLTWDAPSIEASTKPDITTLTVFRHLRSPSLPPAPTTTASPSSTQQMNLRSTRVHKRGHTLLFLLMLCIA